MSAQELSERYSRIALSATPTQYPQLASLETLPNEVLATIIAQALPKDVPTEFDVDVESCSECMDALQITAPHPNKRPESQLEHRYAILYINKRIYTETLRILRARTFRIKIGQGHFFCTALAPENMQRTNIKRLLTNGDWGLVFPGLDLRMIRELAIDIEPTDFQGVWDHVNNALSALCAGQLLLRGPIKKLCIKVKDMECSEYVPVIGPWLVWRVANDPLEFVLRITPAFQDYNNVLQPCERIASAADECEIQLPYWMERHEAKDRLIEDWGKLGAASIVFMPAPFPCLSSEQEAFIRRLNELAPLPNDLLVSRGSGAFEPVRHETVCMFPIVSKATRGGMLGMV